MSDDNAIMAQLLDQMEALVAGVGAVLETQQRLIAKIDAQAESLAAIAGAIGMTYIATGSERPLPPTVLEDQAFNRFLYDYPLDGPPIVGKAAMEDHLVRLADVDPKHLAAGFRELAQETNLTSIERIRNLQIERIARERYGDLDALAKGSFEPDVSSRDQDR